MFNFFKRRREEKEKLKAAEHEGGRLASDLVLAIDADLEERLPKIHENILEVFRGQLNEIYNHNVAPEISPQKIALMDWQILLENLSDYNERVGKQMEEALSEVFEISHLVSVDDLVHTYINDVLDRTKNELLCDAYIELVKAVTEAENKNPTEDGFSMLAKAGVSVEGLAEQLLENEN